ncbi:MAG TPA: carboxyltransferase domain-containing protein [Solirubrobacteraceae bacterium]|nr:carboxyltransferase domain-containing protein [Solirubrobacteraceae bacterium]
MRRCGDHAALLELPDNAAVHVAARLARERFGDELVEVVPGDRTLLLVWPERSPPPERAALALERAAAEPEDGDAQLRHETVLIPTRYDGPDLEAVAAALALSVTAVVHLHAATEFRVAFMGFAPGFPYLLPVEPGAAVLPLLDLPRRTTPRTEVPAGSVAVAAGYCGIYPRRSPGGWNVLGRTAATLFDPAREPPALLEPGMSVRFEAV